MVLRHLQFQSDGAILNKNLAAFISWYHAWHYNKKGKISSMKFELTKDLLGKLWCVSSENIHHIAWCKTRNFIANALEFIANALELPQSCSKTLIF